MSRPGPKVHPAAPNDVDQAIAETVALLTAENVTGKEICLRVYQVFKVRITGAKLRGIKNSTVYRDVQRELAEAGLRKVREEAVRRQMVEWAHNPDNTMAALADIASSSAVQPTPRIAAMRLMHEIRNDEKTRHEMELKRARREALKQQLMGNIAVLVNTHGYTLSKAIEAYASIIAQVGPELKEELVGECRELLKQEPPQTKRLGS